MKHPSGQWTLACEGRERQVHRTGRPSASCVDLISSVSTGRPRLLITQASLRPSGEALADRLEPPFFTAFEPKSLCRVRPLGTPTRAQVTTPQHLSLLRSALQVRSDVDLTGLAFEGLELDTTPHWITERQRPLEEVIAAGGAISSGRRGCDAGSSRAFRPRGWFRRMAGKPVVGVSVRLALSKECAMGHPAWRFPSLSGLRSHTGNPLRGHLGRLDRQYRRLVGVSGDSHLRGPLSGHRLPSPRCKVVEHRFAPLHFGDGRMLKGRVALGCRRTVIMAEIRGIGV